MEVNVTDRAHPVPSAPTSGPAWGTRQRWFIGTNVLLMVLFCAGIYIGLNVIGASRYDRLDWTEEQIYTLSPETIQLLQSLDQEIEVFNLYRPDRGSGIPIRIQEQVMQLVGDLLVEYRQHSDKLVIKTIDPDTDPAAARILQGELELERPNLTIFRLKSGEEYRRKDVMLGDVAEISGGRNQASFRQEAPRLLAFRGEEQFTSAIRGLLEERPTRVLFTTGHGESSPEDFDPARGFSGMARLLRQNNYDVSRVSLLETGAVPAECEILVVAAPDRDFEEAELAAVGEFLDRSGNLLVFLRPLTTCNLPAFLTQIGIQVAPADVLALDTVNYVFNFGQLFLRVRDGLSRSHDITRALTERGLEVVLPLMRPLSILPGSGWSAEKVVQSYGSEQTWGERIRDGKSNGVRDDDEKPGPLTLAVALQKSDAGGRSRVMVFGGVEMATNQYLGSLANRDLLSNSVDWLADKGLYYDIAPKLAVARLVQLDEAKANSFRWIQWGLPLVFGLLLGTIVWWARRS